MFQQQHFLGLKRLPSVLTLLWVALACATGEESPDPTQRAPAGGAAGSGGMAGDAGNAGHGAAASATGGATTGGTNSATGGFSPLPVGGALAAGGGDDEEPPHPCENVDEDSSFVIAESDRCFALISSKGTWQSAGNRCAQSPGGRLVTIPSDLFFARLVANSGWPDWADWVWIGLHDRDEDGVWEWASGDDTPYRSWDGGPSGAGKCAMAHRDGTWQTAPCGEFKLYICEYGE